ncbi:MAG: hypothetical protein IPN83_12070 [Holophagales bacterium]|nr:hypothetical protein [Holophagales bacterium]
MGLPLDAARFRAEVLKRPHLGAFAFLGLVGDRSLPARTWMGLFTELFSGARAASKDPSSCGLSSAPVLQADGASSLDRYCNLFGIVHFAALYLGEDDDPAFVSRERIGLLADFAKSSSAPPELRLDLKLGRALRGVASEEDVVEILGERELSGVFRRVVLGKLPAGSTRLGPFLEQELSSGRIAPAERGEWLDALARLDPGPETAWRPRRGRAGSSRSRGTTGTRAPSPGPSTPSASAAASRSAPRCAGPGSSPPRASTRRPPSRGSRTRARPRPT